MPTNPTPGRSLVTRRAVVDVVRADAGQLWRDRLAGGWIGRLRELFGLGQRGIVVTFGSEQADGGKQDLGIDLDLTVALLACRSPRSPARVDSAVRYSLRNALGRDVTRLDPCRRPALPARRPPAARHHDPNAITADDTAASGTDVA